MKNTLFLLLSLLISTNSFCMLDLSLYDLAHKKGEALPFKDRENYFKLLLLSGMQITDKESLEKSLQESIRKGDNYVAITELLLSHDANPYVKNSDGETPLDTAIKDYQVKTIELLLERKVNPNTISFGQSPLYKICRTNSDTVDKESSKKRIQIASCLLKAGANPNFKSKDSSLLHEVISKPFCAITTAPAFASQEKHQTFMDQRKNLIELLLAHGADLSIKNENDQDPIQAAQDDNYHLENKRDCVELAEYAKQYLIRQLPNTINSQ